MDKISMTQHLIKGCKGGSSSPRTPTEQPDDLQSVAKAKILIALGEGEFAGALTAKDIYLDGTPLENSDGSQNFSGVAWEFRPGTQAQNYIQGIPGSENEINVGVEVSSKTAWSRSFSNTQLSAVRLRLKWPSLLKQEDNGDLVGNAVSYAVDLQTDGGSWQTVLESAVSGKTTSGYERCHRIDLPRATTGWVLRLRKVTVDANTSKTGDVMMLQSYAEVLDAKLRYPNTALLYVEFDSRQFNGSIPKIACSPRGRVIRVPDNYDPETRQYSGIWTGAFKWAWTDNPAWIFYDLIVSDRFGLGNRLTSENIDKWTLYQVARYCDEPVPDGKGGEGTEPRYLCNVYVQDRNDAYTVLRDFAAIFRGMTCWSGDRVIALADMPRDIDYTYTRANVINGRFHYASSSSKTRYTNALVSWSDPENEYADAMEPVFEQPLVARYGFNQLELTAIGCTRQSEANRKGRWGILTNNKDRVVSFSVGLDGNIPQPGYIIAVADEMLAGKVNGGRTREVDGCVITLDRKTEAKAGDRLLLNLPSGGTQGRTIESVDGHVVTVTAEYAERPEPECVWAIESDSLRVQQYRVVGVKDNNDSTFTISAAAHDPDKYARIDSGAIIDSRPISVIPPGKQSAPANIVVESYSVVNQGISVETLQVHWTAVKNAIAYEAQWRRNEGNWINVPRSSVASFDVSGIYAGRYIVRVRAINAAEVSSGWAYSQEKTLTGKIGLPSAPVSLTTTSLLHGVQLNWAFPEGSGDTQKTELQYSPNPTGNGAMALSDVTYPGNSYQQMGLQIAATFWYRARIVDRLGNESPWTVWVQGMASDDIGEYYDKLTDAIKDTEAWQESQRDMEETHKTLTETADAIREEVEQQVNEINQSINETAGGIRKQVDGQIATVNKSITENIDLVNQTLNDAISTVNKSINDAVSDINTSVDQQIADVNKALTAGDSALKSQLQTVENGLKQSIAQANTGWDKAVKQETADRIADVNAKAAQAADQLLNEKNERPTGWQTIVGIQGQNAAGQNSWQGAVTITESGLGERGKWVKFSGKALMNGTGRTRGVVWISTRGATGSGTPGYDLYIDDIVITDVTDAQTALDVADASTTAVSGLTTRVTNAETKITAHSQQITSLQSSLSGKADAGALNTLSSRVTSAEGKIESTASGLTSLNSTVGSLSSTVQAQGQTLSDTNGKVNSTYSIKVETNNGKKVGAGIVLGSDGSTSDMILYADRFSLFNRNSKAAVPVMIAEGNDLYIDSARIKNGTIDIAKITDRLSSTNYVAGWRGWSITKSGSSEFNNVVVRGEIQADTGTLNNVVINESCNILGTVRANKIIGDVGSWAINIAQHRSRRIAKAQWAWFDLLAVDRQPFEQRVQLLGALRQDDSINITGGGKLTAGMEYKSYEGGSLSMGKLGYCILMLGTGDTSGGGPMTCALSIDGVLYKQENYSMEIQSMDFIVPPGTGQTVVRYGYYLDRNGGMTGVILSRFHAFVMRNSNIIRGVSSD